MLENSKTSTGPVKHGEMLIGPTSTPISFLAPPNSPIIQPTPSAMQIWRRTFATSVGRLTHSSINSRSVVRCAQILQASKNGGVGSFEDQKIKVNGFIRSVRKQKRFAFAEISDGSTVEPLQAILKPAQAAEYVRPRASCDSRPVCQRKLI